MVISNSIMFWADFNGMPFKSLNVHVKTSLCILEKVPPTPVPSLDVIENSPSPVVPPKSPNWVLLTNAPC